MLTDVSKLVALQALARGNVALSLFSLFCGGVSAMVGIGGGTLFVPYFKPSGMEPKFAITWPGRYIVEDGIRRATQRVNLGRSRDLDIEHIARQLRQNPAVLRNWNRRGLDQIALGLRRNTIAVF